MAYGRYPRKTRRYGSSRSGYRKSRKTNGSTRAVYPVTSTSLGKTRTYSGYKNMGKADKAMKPELKYFDVDGCILAGSTSINFPQPDPTGGTLGTPLNLVPVGSAADQMLGRKITIKSLLIRIMVGENPDTDAFLTLNFHAGIDLRLIVVLDTQTNGTVLKWSEVFKPSWNLKYSSLDVADLANGSRFRILCNKQLRQTPPAVTQSGSSAYNVPNVRQFEYYKRMNVPIEFSAPATPSLRNIAEVRSNCLFAFVVRETPGGGPGTDATTVPYGQFFSRIRFTDA